MKKEKRMKKSVLIMLIALIVVGCVALTSCQTKAKVNYVNLGLELKNKTEKTIVEYYIYETGAASHYNNLIAGMAEAVDGKWLGGKTKVYPKGFIIRPEAESFEIMVVFEDGTSMIIPEIELLKADSDGRLPNEISLKPDPNDIKVQFDDDEDVQPAIDAAIAAGVTMDGWYPN